MIRTASILLLLLLCFQFLFKAGVAGYYFANKEYIARVLCINKENKEMHCDGKCYLMQKMKAAGQPSEHSAITVKYEPVEFLTTPFVSVVAVQGMLNQAIRAEHICSYSFAYSNAIFQPPC